MNRGESFLHEAGRPFIARRDRKQLQHAASIPVLGSRQQSRADATAAFYRGCGLASGSR